MPSYFRSCIYVRALKYILFSLLFTAFLPLLASAAAIENTSMTNSLFWPDLASGKTTIMRYNGPGGAISIPDSVTTIGEYAFAYCSSLTAINVDPANPAYASIGGVLFNKDRTTLIRCPAGHSGPYIIPDSVVAIKGRAFFGCSSLTAVTIPNSVTNIGISSFFGCTSLTSVTIPDSVTTIGFFAFSGCSSLTSVTIPASVNSIGFAAFSGCAKLTSVTIPDSVNSIGSSAFYNCKSLTSVTIPDSVTSISYRAFSWCKSLSSITIPDSVTTIGEDAFAYCTSLTSVTIPASVTNIGLSAFRNCTNLNMIAVDAGNKFYSSRDGVLFNKAQTTLIQCPGNKTGSFAVPASATIIVDHAFYGCRNLKSVTIPASVTNIGLSAFRNCSNLNTITVDTDNKFYSSRDGVLFNKAQTTLIQCPGNKTGSFAIPASVAKIGVGAFSCCTRLTDVIIPDSVSRIESATFVDCLNMTNVVIPASNAAIHSDAFKGCTKLPPATLELIKSISRFPLRPTRPVSRMPFRPTRPVSRMPSSITNQTPDKLYVPDQSTDFQIYRERLGERVLPVTQKQAEAEEKMREQFKKLALETAQREIKRREKETANQALENNTAVP